MEFVLAVLTLIFGGGWMFTYHAYKRKNEGEATQSEANGWAAMQSLYEKTIADFDKYGEDMRKEREVLKTENRELRERYKKTDDEIIDLKKKVARQGRKIDALSPFLCGVVGCVNRKRVNISALASNDEEEYNQEVNDGTYNQNEKQ